MVAEMCVVTGNMGQGLLVFLYVGNLPRNWIIHKIGWELKKKERQIQPREFHDSCPKNRADMGVGFPEDLGLLVNTRIHTWRGLKN